MKVAGLFDGPAPRVRNIPASAPFLDTLVDAVVRALPADDPFALADTVIFLPNRRASRGLIDAFAARLGGAALLPAIRPLGDLEDDPDVWGPEPVTLDVPPAIEPLRRRFELAQLVRARDVAEGGVADPVRALAWADELCRLLDAAATTGGVDWTRLPTLVTERDLAAHWRRSAEFLGIIADYWPKRLALDGLADPGVRRGILLTRLAEMWTRTPTPSPVIIAGSTGSVAASRTLMQAVARLPRGVVVLPGLDADLDDDTWRQIDAQHPQYALKTTLEALGVARADVAALSEEEGASARARRQLLREALVPADATADWRARVETLGGKALIESGAQGLSVIEARNEEEEALAIALLLRGALEVPGKTAALVTPDATLARRVEAKLARWDIVPQKSIGEPLAETGHGVFVRLLAELIVDEGEPVTLLALLRHPLAGLGLTAENRPHAIMALERVMLRGARSWSDLDDLAARIAREHGRRRNETLRPVALDLVQRVAAALQPLRAARLSETLDLETLAEALADAARGIARDAADGGLTALGDGPAGESTLQMLADMAAFGANLGAIASRDAPRAVHLLMSAREAPPPPGGHPRISILGPLEARLQRRDLMILGGLVEGGWPAPPPEDAFLSRAMRRDLGLPEPDARIGLAAHDFAQLANAPEVVLTRPAQRDGAPTVASRWLWRLKTLARAGGDEKALDHDGDLVRWAQSVDTPPRSVRLAPPRPRPPATARLKSLSFTEVERLIRDPYAVYARRILGLEPLDAPGAVAGPAERGTAIHWALEHHGRDDTVEMLLDRLNRALADAGFGRERRRTERMRLMESARVFVDWDARRLRDGYAAHREVDAHFDLGDDRWLRGRADRIDIRPDGLAEVIDFKTGAPPTGRQVNSGLAPQLTLEAALIAEGGFAKEGIQPTQTAALIYWRFGGRDPGPQQVGDDVNVLARKTLDDLRGLFARYADPAQAFLSKPRVQFANTWDDFDHFARRVEWADVAGDGE
jgi:ATP-dependent helicase/nuclease subunit B